MDECKPLTPGVKVPNKFTSRFGRMFDSSAKDPRRGRACHMLFATSKDAIALNKQGFNEGGFNVHDVVPHIGLVD